MADHTSEYGSEQPIYDTLLTAFTSAARTLIRQVVGPAPANTPAFADILTAAEQTLTSPHGYPLSVADSKALTVEALTMLEDEPSLLRCRAMDADMLEDDAETCGKIALNMLLTGDTMESWMDNPRTPLPAEALRPAIAATPAPMWAELTGYMAKLYALTPPDVDELICMAWHNLGSGTRDVRLDDGLSIPAGAIGAALTLKPRMG